MLISIFHWLLLVEGVADSIGFLTYLLGIHLYTKGSFLKTLALPFLALGASGPTFRESLKCWKLIPFWLPSYNDGCELMDKYPAASPQSSIGATMRCGNWDTGQQWVLGVSQ